MPAKLLSSNEALLVTLLLATAEMLFIRHLLKALAVSENSKNQLTKERELLSAFNHQPDFISTREGD